MKFQKKKHQAKVERAHRRTNNKKHETPQPRDAERPRPGQSSARNSSAQAQRPERARAVGRSLSRPNTDNHHRFPLKARYQGTIRISAKGVGYVSVPELRDDDIEIDPAFLHTALDGDQVEIVLHSRIVGIRQGGEVTKIILRNKMRFVGTLTREDGTYFCVPDDVRMYRPILLPKQEVGDGKVGDKVYVEIKKWIDQMHDPLGEVLKVIGKAGMHETEMEAIVLERGFDATFPSKVHEAAEEIPTTIDEEEIAKRRDFRKILTMTIDPKDAKDFDDALSWQILPNGNIEVGVHIADVTHYVIPGSVLDQEAAERGTSIYLVDRTIPMLPERLSNGICSLVPDEDRLTFAAVFELNSRAEIVQEWFGKTIIHSHKRFNYEEAQAVLDADSGLHIEALRSLNTLAKKLRDERIKNGAIAFEAQEVKFELDENGKPVRVYQKILQDTNKLIEEFMLLANKRVAQYIATKDKNTELTFVYRVHDEPVAEKITDLRDYLKTIGITLKANKTGGVDAREINRMLQEVSGHAEETMIQMATIRAMSKAVYSTKNIGHFGLGFEYYTHFTSPIRRYPDMMVHRLLDQYLKNRTIPKKVLEEQEHVARYASQMEIAAAEAERASIKLKQVEYWSERVGEEWSGKISGVTEWGFYVEDSVTKCEGMVPMRDINDDFYMFEQKNYRIVGKNKKRIFRLGDVIRVRVRAVDVKKKQITLALVK